MHIPPEMFKVEAVMVILSATVVLIKYTFLTVAPLKLLALVALLLIVEIFTKAPIPSCLWCSYLMAAFEAKIETPQFTHKKYLLDRCLWARE